MKYVYFSARPMAIGIILLPIGDIKSVNLSSVLDLIISNPEKIIHSFSSLPTKMMLTSKPELSQAPGI